MRLLAMYNISIFPNFERFLRTEVDLVEDDIRLVLDEYNSSFITYEKQPGVYTYKDLSEALLRVLKPENEGYHNAIVIEINYLTMKTKLVVRSGIKTIRFNGSQSSILSLVLLHIGFMKTTKNTLAN